MAVFKRLVSITRDSVHGGGDVDPSAVYLRFSADAQPVFDKWLKAHRKREKNPDLHPMMAEHLTKYRSLCPSLALVFHLVDVGSGPVGLASLQRALRWMEYLEGHAERCFSSLLTPEVVAAKLIIKRIRGGQLPIPFTARVVYNNSWSGLADAKTVHGAIGLLEDKGWVKTEAQGRTKKSHLVYPHPSLLSEDVSG
jgi:putative DNA primase/helicase